MAKKNQFYTVWRGRKTGIFDSWERCKAEVSGYEGAQYKGYSTKEEAERAFKQNYWKSIKTKEPAVLSDISGLKANSASPILKSLSVDAACSGNPGIMEYRGVLTQTREEQFRIGTFEDATNNIGEFLALVHGLALLKKEGNDMPIYSDSKTAIAWVKAKKCKTKLEHTSKNSQLFELIARAEQWLAINTYSTKIIKWETEVWGEIPADFGRK